MAKHELSNQDLLEAMNKRFNMVFAQFERNEKQFALLSSKLYSIHTDVREVKELQEEQ